MSLIITLYTREGIVMASDSRLTLNAEQGTPNGKKVLVAAGMSDSSYKTFLAPNNVGISTFAQADIKGVPISGYIDTFIREHVKGSDTVTDVAQNLKEYFRGFNPIPDAGFHVAGYERKENGLRAVVYKIAPFHDAIKHINPDRTDGDSIQGATWDGESDILSRIVQPVFLRDGKRGYQQLPHFQIPWQFFTIQDAIDFAVYAIRTTIDSLRFLPRPKTVGGPIDVLVIKPSEATWISKKSLATNQFV